MQESANNENVPEPNVSAKAEANRQNAKFSTGPKSVAGKIAASQNARRHGLTARTDWSGPDGIRKRAFMHHCYAALAPENALEEIQISNLLDTRLLDDRFIIVEREVLLRRPVTQTLNEDSYTFLNDPESVAILSKLTRHFTHNSRLFEKSVLALMKIRTEAWAPFTELLAQSTESSEPTPAENEPDTNGVIDGAPINRGTLEDLLSDARLIFPAEDSGDLAALSQDLWNSFAPTNLLEAFVVTDFILAQWRIERLKRLDELFFERFSTSTSGTHCGPGFAFIRDHQSNHALDTLRQYECALQKHQEKRMILFRKLRSEGKSENDLATAPAATMNNISMEQAQTTPVTESESNTNQKTSA